MAKTFDPVGEIREVLIAATDMVGVGEEPYVGWSLVLAERIAAALGLDDPDAAVDRLMVACVDQLGVASLSNREGEAILKAALTATDEAQDG
jgi:microcompartment protein CcmK/EutM